MKVFFAAAVLTISTTAFAGFPQVWNTGSTVSLDYWNSSNRDERCSGNIYLYLENNTQETIRVFEYARARSSVHISFYPNTFGTRIRSISHSVSCW